DVFTAKKPLISSRLAIMDPPEDIMVRTTPLRKSLIQVKSCDSCQRQGTISQKDKIPKMQFKYARSLTYGASTLWAHSRLLEGTSKLSWPLTTCLNGLKRKRSPLMMPELL
ncbi:hypothetical protein Tco_0203388, partial [Tanacetum coccineum]